jgi:hypothetical protein
MAGEPFAGVDLNNVGETAGSESNAPSTENLEVSGDNKPDSQQSTPSTQTTAEQLADLDKLERVRFGGKELTVKELKAALMRQSDYTKKTKELAETRKYAENFAYDFAKVVRQPSLMAELKNIYPAQYVEMVESYLKEQGIEQNAEQPDVSGQDQSIPADVQKLLDERLKPFQEQLSEFQSLKQSLKEQETKAISQQLDTLHDKYGKKYPYADPDLVDFRIQIAKEKGVEITRDNLGEVYEQVYKSLHEHHEKRLNAQQKAKVTEQVKAGQAAKDVSGGAGIPAAAPKKYKKFAEITQDALAAFGGK